MLVDIFVAGSFCNCLLSGPARGLWIEIGLELEDKNKEAVEPRRAFAELTLHHGLKS